ncbi:MAG TPA: methyltransferase domain-containing protein, partial [Stellaceae bacterium]|nr:methyltransferase domain-containing protein [Stellaceae bacterium]
MAWDPGQYLKFAGPRLRPALDLLQRIDYEAPSLVYDLGAGAGNVTQLIAARWPDATIVGVDSSAEMLAKAAAENPKIEWQQADLATWRPARRPDIIYSNAALHWLDNHPELLSALLASLAPKGLLAVQMPRNFSARSHTSITEAALAGPWRSVIEPLLRPAPVAEPEFYYDLLAPQAATLDMW